MMKPFTIARPRQLSSVLKWEVEPLFSRATGAFKAATAAALGTVLGQLTADGTLVPLDTTKTDGSETVAGVLLQAVDPDVDDPTSVLYLNDLSAVSASGLVWPAGIVDADKASAIAALRAMRIKVLDY